MTGTDVTSAVRSQYEELPYPHRNPEDESRRLVQTVGGSLYIINHFCFGARRDFRRGFRCLVAGGGTGDCLIFLAEQLRDFDAEIVYVDFSAAARRIAEQRARQRGLDNITWITASLLEIPDLDLGEFDFINCSGVLHHLESAEQGLAALAQVLKDDGGMFVMLYGKYGRRVVYDMQSLLRAYLPATATAATRISMTRQLLEALPPSNSFGQDIARWSAELEHDAGLFDLLLHSQDRCFTVPEVHELGESQGLRVLGFIGADALYDPAAAVSDPAIQEHLRSFPLQQQQAIAELLHGNMIKHEFFLGRNAESVASLDDDDNTLLAYNSLFHDAPKIAASMPDGQTLNYRDDWGGFSIETNSITRIALAHMDGRTSLKNLYRAISRQLPGVDRVEIKREIKRLYDTLHPRGYLYLLRKGSQDHRILALDELARIARRQSSE